MADKISFVQNLPLQVLVNPKVDATTQQPMALGRPIYRLRTFGEWKPLRHVFASAGAANAAQLAHDALVRASRADETRVAAAYHSFWITNSNGDHVLVVIQHVDDLVRTKAHEASQLAHPTCMGCQLAFYDAAAAQGVKTPDTVRGLTDPEPRDANGTPKAYLRVVGTLAAHQPAGGFFIQASRVDLLGKKEWEEENCEACITQTGKVVQTPSLLGMLTAATAAVGGAALAPPGVVLLSAIDAKDAETPMLAGLSPLAQRIMQLKGNNAKLAKNPAMGAYLRTALLIALDPSTTTVDEVNTALDELQDKDQLWFQDDLHFNWV